MNTIEHIARICHETNKAYCDSIGDSSQKHYDEAEEWQRQSAITGVIFALKNPTAPASAQHDAWCKEKFADNWVYGPRKDPEKKQHPCLLPFEHLPPQQRLKDYLFRAVVGAFVSAGIAPNSDQIKQAMAESDI